MKPQDTVKIPWRHHKTPHIRNNKTLQIRNTKTPQDTVRGHSMEMMCKQCGNNNTPWDNINKKQQDTTRPYKMLQEDTMWKQQDTTNEKQQDTTRYHKQTHCGKDMKTTWSWCGNNKMPQDTTRKQLCMKTPGFLVNVFALNSPLLQCSW